MLDHGEVFEFTLCEHVGCLLFFGGVGDLGEFGRAVQKVVVSEDVLGGGFAVVVVFCWVYFHHTRSF